MDYIYDGTFQGLLTCIYLHYYEDKASGIFTGDTYQVNMLGGYRQVETDEEKADRVYRAMEEKIGHYAVRCMYKVFLSSYPDKEMRILNFAVLGFRLGPKVTLMHGDDTVLAVEEVVRRISREKEKMLQFVRFSELEGGVLYAQIEPDHDVTELLGTHFADRYRFQPIIIHDVSRDKALFAYGNDWYLSDLKPEDVPDKSADEMEYRRLWQTYFDHIAIKERINPRCQANHVPMRYRKHLVEFDMRTGQNV